MARRSSKTWIGWQKGITSGFSNQIRFISEDDLRKGFLLEIKGNHGTPTPVILEEWNPKAKHLKYSLLEEGASRLPAWRTYTFEVGRCDKTRRSYIDLTMKNTLPIGLDNFPFTKLGLVETVLGRDCVPIPK